MKILHGRKWRAWLATLPVLGALVGGLAAAQATRPPQQQPAAPRGQSAQAGAPRENVDVYLAHGVALENDNEFMLAKFAQTRAEGKDVIKFAETMEKDHEQFARDLQKFAGNMGTRRNRQENREGEEGAARSGATGEAGEAAAPRVNRRDAVPPQGQANPGQPAPGGQPAAPPTQAHPQSGPLGNVFAQIKEELADECLTSAQRELQEKKGAKFDNCYLGMQLGAHMKMIDTLKVFEQHATPELQRVFHKGQETAQKHFDHAKELMKDRDGVQTTARRDNDSQE
jgi:predicted outer membrane protein